MKKHQQRFWAISVGLLLSVILIAVLTFTDQIESWLFTFASGGATVLLAAWLDALQVERRRRTPTTPAISDDVESETLPNP